MSALVIISAVLFGTVFFVLLVVAPRILALLMWPVIMIYPHAVTYGMLPMNVGLDDLFITFLFIVTVLRLGFPKFSFPLKAAILFYLILLFSNLTGLVVSPISVIDRVLKESIKTLTLIMFTTILLSSLKDEKYFRLHIYSFLLSFAIASLIAIADHFGMAFAQLFYIVVDEKVHFRAYGPFLSPSTIGITLQLPLFIAITGITIQGNNFYKLLCSAITGIFGLTLLLSGSRTGWLGVAIAFIPLFFTIKRRIVLIVLGSIVILVLLYIVGSEEINKVIEVNVERTQYGVGAHGAGRFELWRVYVNNPYFAMLLAGRGIIANQAMGFDTPHNGYFDVIFLFGLAGIIFFTVAFWKIVKASRYIAKYDYDAIFNRVGQGIFIALFGWLGAALTSDPPLDIFWRYTFFFTLGILLSRLDYIQNRTAEENYQIAESQMQNEQEVFTLGEGDVYK
jgi:hypothetical protein